MVRHLRHAALALGLIAFASQPAHAQLSAAGIGAFTGATVLDFNGIGNESPIVNQYAGQGVTFGGALFAMTNSGDLNLFPSNGGGTIASNWLYSRGAHQGLGFTAAFSQAHTRVGFWLENWPNQTGVIELFLGATSLGQMNFAPTTSLTAQFFGVSSVGGFDNLTFTSDAATNGFFAIDDFQFDGTPRTVVPEPGSLALVGFGLLGVIGAGVRRRRRSE